MQQVVMHLLFAGYVLAITGILQFSKAINGFDANGIYRTSVVVFVLYNIVKTVFGF